MQKPVASPFLFEMVILPLTSWQSRIYPVDIIGRAREIIGVERDALTSLVDSIGTEFEKAIGMMMLATKAKGRIVVSGMGKSGIIGKKISSTLSSVGTPSFFMHPAEAIHGDLGMLDGDDLLIAISYSGESEEMARLIPIVKRFGLRMIALCGRKDSTLAKSADVFIDVSVKAEACQWDIVPTSSTTAALAMGDALSIVLMEKRGFNQEGFAKRHPGGSLGRGMLVKVEDLMTTGDSLPIVDENVSLAEAVEEISSKKLGMTVVTGGDGRLKGILTDGDLRRIFGKIENPMAKKVSELVSSTGKTIEKEAMGGAAVKVMEDNKITSLLIVTADNKPEGVVHLHDLLKAGVV